MRTTDIEDAREGILLHVVVQQKLTVLRRQKQTNPESSSENTRVLARPIDLVDREIGQLHDLAAGWFRVLDRVQVNLVPSPRYEEQGFRAVEVHVLDARWGRARSRLVIVMLDGEILGKGEFRQLLDVEMLTRQRLRRPDEALRGAQQSGNVVVGVRLVLESEQIVRVVCLRDTRHEMDGRKGTVPANAWRTLFPSQHPRPLPFAACACACHLPGTRKPFRRRDRARERLSSSPSWERARR